MTDLIVRPSTAQSETQKLFYAGLYVLKLLDLKPTEGGVTIPVLLPADLDAIDGLLDQMALSGWIEINTKKARWEITKAGYEYLGRHIDEAAALVEEFEESEIDEVVAELRRRNLDPFRARFLWGWFEGEFDDLLQFQQRRGVKDVEPRWAEYVLGDEFYAELARELSN